MKFSRILKSSRHIMSSYSVKDFIFLPDSDEAIHSIKYIGNDQIAVKLDDTVCIIERKRKKSCKTI